MQELILITVAALVALAVSVAADLAVVVLVDSKIFSIHSLRRRYCSVDPNAPRQGADLQYTIQLKFEEAIFGVEKRLSTIEKILVQPVAVMAPNQAHTQKLVINVMALEQSMLNVKRH